MDSDAVLLQAFAVSRDESAFRRMVDRYAPMVHGVALRGIQKQALAEDITQTVFTILARKAHQLTHTELAGWLHRAATLETQNVRRKEARRERAIRRMFDHMIQETNPDPKLDDLNFHLDQAMSQLPAAERQMIVLRFFQQYTHREISSVTGKTEEASRKHLQRSLEHLSSLLRRRGFSTSATALTAIFTTQVLCVPPASAAALTVAALQAAPGLSASMLFAHTFNAMTVSTGLKTACVTLVLATIPLGLLWESNQNLREEVERLNAARLSPPPSSLTGQALMPVSTYTISENAGQPTRPAMPDPAAVPAGLLTGDNLIRIAESQSLQDMDREINRLSLRLLLSPVQKEQLVKFLQAKHTATITALRLAASDGTLERLIKNAHNPNSKDAALIAKLSQADEKVGSTRAFLDALLSPEQQQEYQKSQSEQRISRAEERAQSVISSLGQIVDLNAGQKDHIFAAIAQKDLEGPNAADAPNRLNLPPLGGFGIDTSDDDILRQHLTQDQFSLLQTIRAQSSSQVQEMLRSASSPSSVENFGN